MLKKLTLEEFIAKAKLIHGDKYDYSLVTYVNSKTKVTIVCPHHKEFNQIPSSHLTGCGCPYCENKFKTTEQFIKESNKIHFNKFDYSEAQYKDAFSKVKINCVKHGPFFQSPSNHLAGQGCPMCNYSHGERTVYQYLKGNDINFIPQHTFDDCKGSRNKLPFDFYLPELNLCIEYQGEQHFRKMGCWDEKKLDRTKQSDKLKKDYCALRGIKLLEITYDQDPIKLLEATLQNKITQA